MRNGILQSLQHPRSTQCRCACVKGGGGVGGHVVCPSSCAHTLKSVCFGMRIIDGNCEAQDMCAASDHGQFARFGRAERCWYNGLRCRSQDMCVGYNGLRIIVGGKDEAQDMFAASGRGQFVWFGRADHCWCSGLRCLLLHRICEDVVVLRCVQPVRIICVACRAWSSCVLGQVHNTEHMFGVWVFMRCRLFESHSMVRLRESACIARSVCIFDARSHRCAMCCWTCGCVGRMHNMRLRCSSLPSMHTTMA